MKIEDKKGTIIGFTILLIICVICYFYNRSTLREEAENISSKPIYTIGLFTDYNSGGAGMYGSTSGYVKILFIANDKLIEVEPRISRQTSTQEVGKKFLVIYYKDNPTECLLLLDYPIKDSTDFKRYLEEFKTKPLDISKYF